MNLGEWHRIRDIAIERHRPMRLDCLNPFTALAAWRLQSNNSYVTPNALLSGFRTVLKLRSDNCILTKGVRSLLRSVMKLPQVRQSHWLIPSDVFPAYHQLANEAGIHFSKFRSWKSLDLTLLRDHSESTVMLLPIPHSPTGKIPSSDEVCAILSWLNRSKSNYLILDLVYAYRHLDIPEVKHFAESEQVFFAYSTSKTWLQRCLAGCAEVPKVLFKDLSELAELPSREEAGLAMQCLERQVTLPAFQDSRFKEAWSQLKPTLQSLNSDWEPPTQGYMSTLQVPWNVLLESHNILGVPPALFGSSENESTVITCIHDLVENYGS